MRCFIQFTRNSAIYFGGELVSGVLIIQTAKKIEIKKITITSNGLAKNVWVVNAGRSQRRYASFVDIPQFSIFYENTEAPVGETQFPFSFRLPPNSLPSTRVAQGRRQTRIQYDLKADIDTGGWLNKKTEKRFYVNIMLDVASFPHLIPPISQYTNEHTCESCFWPCQSTEVPLHLSIPKQGWMAGETLAGTLLIDNPSSNEFNQLKLELTQFYEIIAFYTPFATKRFAFEQDFMEPTCGNQRNSIETTVFSNSTAIDVKSKTTELLKFCFQIPPITPNFACATIRLTYKLKVSLSSPRKCTWDLSIKCNLVIGSNGETPIIPEMEKEQFAYDNTDQNVET